MRPKTHTTRLAACKAALVRSLMALASASATAAKTWSNNVFASGTSQAAKSAPESRTVAINRTERLRRSSFATSNVALARRAYARASASLGLLLLRPDSISMNSRAMAPMRAQWASTALSVRTNATGSHATASSSVKHHQYKAVSLCIRPGEQGLNEAPP